jgi:hypothetical protein
MARRRPGLALGRTVNDSAHTRRLVRLLQGCATHLSAARHAVLLASTSVRPGDDLEISGSACQHQASVELAVTLRGTQPVAPLLSRRALALASYPRQAATHGFELLRNSMPTGGRVLGKAERPQPALVRPRGRCDDCTCATVRCSASPNREQPRHRCDA